MKTFHSNSISDTQEFAHNILQELIEQKKFILTLSGDLGAGKTAFTQELAKYLQCQHQITSPTFTILKLYNLSHDYFKRLCHVDAYRISSIQEIYDLGLHDFLNDPQTLTVIEWPEKIIDALEKYKKNTIDITITHGTNQTERTFIYSDN